MSAPPIRATYALVDHHGSAVTEATYRGSWQLVQFGFTHCRVVCPRALAKLDEALDLLGDGSPVVALYVTVDPERDTPEVMRAFLAADHPRFTGLTGSAAQTRDAAAAFRVFARRGADPDEIRHTAITYLLDPDGRPAHHWPDTADAATIAADLAGYVLA
ncbi:protein SCO1/2 [Actinomycetospora succinea]|uniref:Protein SCO1/2 n=1 Tax=Actinomycetospora succinea TaxID=663603 RepID=A0A4R6VHY6_9PSEU|nr:SCO family protein [Actinomycetospora succinea]TDQ62386.1 protein SCO1/2 [Actinomycetospora succinea]